MGMRTKGVQFDPDVKILVRGVENRVEYVTTTGRFMNCEEGTVEILEDPWVSPKEKADIAEKAKKAKAAAKAKATRAANKKAKAAKEE